VFTKILPFVCFLFILVPMNIEGHNGSLRRQKREWILAPKILKEGQDYTTEESVVKIRSDKETEENITYSLTGHGADKDPKDRFQVDPNSGNIKVNSILDREEIAQYKLFGVAKFPNGSRAEKDITIMIRVKDINDCTPVIKVQQVGRVSEHSNQGTVVMKVIATDDDDNTTENAWLSYRIDERSNSGGMFSIKPQTGEVRVAKTTLDRETKDTYKLIILASDEGGKPGGNTGTGEIEIKLTDINDNIPTLYEGSVEENTVGVEVLRIQAVDLDMINTENWFAVYEIVSGNEGGYFNISTDKKTNEGVITITKALDYEEIKALNLAVKVKNEAEYNFGSSMSITGASGSKSYPININVVNQKEGARFKPSVKSVTVSEEKTSISLDKVITTYAAIDSDTLKTATNVRYAKLKDEDNWFSIDPITAGIKLNKYPDRESKYLVNGRYYAEIICISNDIPSKTATGTIVIQVEDFNDHCPTLTSTTRTVCFGDNVVYVTAEDEDGFPNSAPFTFEVIQGDSKEKWDLEPFNKTTVLLRHQGSIWPGLYKAHLEIKDQQGTSCSEPQIIDITVCKCQDRTKACLSRSKSKVTFGAGGILLMLLGLLLLLLVPLLLLICLCGSAAREFKTIPFEAKEHLILYHTEGQGEDKDMPGFQVPVQVDGGTLKMRNINMSGGQAYLDSLVCSQHPMGGGGTLTAEDMNMYKTYNHKYSAGQNQMDFMGGGAIAGQNMRFSQHRAAASSDMALSEHHLGQYFSDVSFF
uniref:Desmoglein-2-like n=1 Tax=Fundulus heteroclitus TaxID=8078 RepID=A0A3Q2SXI9_FUNHE